MKNLNKSGFSIIVGMGLVLVMSLSAYFILSFIIPFSKNIKGIENSSSSYYEAYAGIENAMYFVNKVRTNLTTETGATTSAQTGYSYYTVSSGATVPLPGTGNSDFDTTKNYNVLSSSEPLQLEVGGLGSIWNNINFYFKVPDVGASVSTLTGGTTMALLSWTLTTPSDTFTASGSFLKAGDINNSAWTIWNKSGVSLNGTAGTFSEYYTGGGNFTGLTADNVCSNSNVKCSLKISVINSLNLNDTSSTSVPYLEYKITFPNGTNAPLRFTTINSSGKSYGFKKDISVKIGQQVTNQAFDFAVFQ